MATRACPVAKWLAGPVPVSAFIKNAGKVSDLARIDRFESRSRQTYTPKKQAVCLKFRRQAMARRHDSRNPKIEGIA